MSTNSSNREKKEVRAGYIVKIQVKNADLYYKLVPVGRTVLTGGSSAGYDGYLGSVTTLGTSGWKKIQDVDGSDILVPIEETLFYQCFFGISKTRARIYKQFVSGRDKGALNKSLTLGGTIGYVDGNMSPFYDPSHETEFWMLKGYDIAFNAYNPTSITSDVKLNFLINKYRAVDATQEIKNNPILKNVARTIALGGEELVNAVQWMSNQITKTKDI